MRRTNMGYDENYKCDGQTDICEYIEQRKAGEMTTLETRGEAHETVDKQKRYAQIIECLTETPELTAKECAVIMMQKCYVPTSERNFTAPRLTEMSRQGIVEIVGKKVCSYTGKKVAVYSLRRQ